MFDWLGEIISGAFDGLSKSVSGMIFDMMLRWVYSIIYDAVAEFFGKMSAMAADIFSLPWVEAVVRLFHRFGWALFVVGMVVAIFDVAIESQSGRASPKTAALNIIKGLLATAMFSIVPVELYKFCVTLQNTFLSDIGHLMAGTQSLDLGAQSVNVLEGSFKMSLDLNTTLFSTLSMIAFAYSVIKVFFANLKRGGILIIQIAVGSLYLFSVPRGYSDGFWQWCKQVAALCLTAFLQTTLLFVGLLTFPDHMILGMGIMLAASEVPRIAQQFGLDTSAKVNLSSVVHMTSTAVNLTKSIAR